MTKRKSKAPATRRTPPREWDLGNVDLSPAQLWFWAAVAAGGYVLFSLLSTGVYSDDELAHYLNCRAFFQDPTSILGYWHRPGFKILYALPALAGEPFIHLAMSFTAAATGALAALTARRLGLRNAVLSLAFVVLAPLLYQIAFRTYTEILAAFLLALLLFFYTRNRMVPAALTATYLFTVRQEFALVALLLGVRLVFEKRWIPLLLLGVSPVVLGVLGWMKSGDGAWLLHTYLQWGETGERFAGNVPKPGFLHYFRMALPVFGTLGGALALVGWLTVLPAWREHRLRAHLRRFHALYILSVVLFLLQAVLASGWVTSPSPGNLRHVLPLVSVVALFANLGMEQWWTHDRSRRTFAWITWGAISAVTALWLSHPYNHFVFLPAADYSKLVVLVLFAGGVWALYRARGKARWLVQGTVVLALVHTVYAEPPIRLDPARQAAADVAAWTRDQHLDNRLILANHPYIYYVLGTPQSDTGSHLRSLRLKTLQEAPPGTLIIWDSHYGFREAFGYDVTHLMLEKDTDRFRKVHQKLTNQPIPTTGGVQYFGIWVYEKL